MGRCQDGDNQIAVKYRQRFIIMVYNYEHYVLLQSVYCQSQNTQVKCLNAEAL